MGSFCFDIRLIIKPQLMENLKLLRALHFFLTENFELRIGYSAFHQRCRILNLKPEYGNLGLFMESYLIPKNNTFVPSLQMAQPLSLIPEIAEIDKLSDKAVKDKLTSPPRPGILLGKMSEKPFFKPLRIGPIKASGLLGMGSVTKMAFNANSVFEESPEIRQLKTSVVMKLEEKWDKIALINEVLNNDEKTVDLLRKIEVN